MIQRMMKATANAPIELRFDEPRGTWSLTPELLPLETASIEAIQPLVQEVSRCTLGRPNPKLIITPSWGAAAHYLVAFALLSLISIQLSATIPSSVLSLQLPWKLSAVSLNVPLFLLPAAYVLFKGLCLVYGSYAEMNDKALRYHHGLFTLRHKVSEMETPSLLVIEYSQSLLGRLFDTGTVSVGRYSRKAMEFEIPGVRNPRACVRLMKKRIKAARERQEAKEKRLKRENT